MKRLFVILMTISMLFVLFTNGVVAVSPYPIYGDANGDHRVNMGDVVYLERVILGFYPETPGCDANQKDGVSVGDIIWIERQILGLEPIYGDVDGNSIVNQNDIKAIQKIILGGIPTPGADANRDGSIDVVDITYIELQIKD
jgi:hypothetical protein